MTIAVNDRISGPYTAASGQTVFTFDFPVAFDSHIIVQRLRAGVAGNLTLNVDYTVTRTLTGGSITLATGAVLNDKIAIYGSRPIERTTEFPGFRSIPPQAVEDELDNLAKSAQELRRDASLSLRRDYVTGVFDAKKLRIINVEDGQLDTDVPSLGQIRPLTEAAAASAAAAAASEAAAAASADRINLGDFDASVAATALAAAAADASKASAATSSTNATNAAATAAAAAGSALSAIIAAGIYADEPTGRAAVANGVYFAAVGATTDKSIDIWQRNSAGASTFFRSYYSYKGINDILKGAAADKFVEAAGAVTPSVYRAVSWVNGNQYIIDIEAKAGERSKLNVFCNTGLSVNATFDLANGTVNAVGASISLQANGFYNCRIIGTASSTLSGNLQLRMCDANGSNSYTGDNASGLYVKKASVRQGYNGDNLLASPSDFSTWSKITNTVTTAATSSSGVLDNVTLAAESLSKLNNIMFDRTTADKIIEASGASVSPSAYKTMSWQSGTTYYIEALIKKGERSRVNLICTTAALFNVTFDLTKGVVEAIATGANPSIEPRGNGFYLCRVQTTAATTASGNVQVRTYSSAGGQPYAGDGTSGLYIEELAVRTTPLTGANLLSVPTYTLQNCTVSYDVLTFPGLQSSVYEAMRLLSKTTQTWAGKIHALLGDSLTSQNQYAALLANLLGTTATNLGVSGTSLGVTTVGHAGSLGIYNQIASIPTNADLVTLLLGTNDFGANVTPLGVLGDATTSTFYGALDAAAVAINARAPNARIIYMIAHNPGAAAGINSMRYVRGDGKMLRDFQKAIREVGDALGIPVVDCSKSPVNFWTAGSKTSDGLHYNSIGGADIAAFAAPLINAIKPLV